MLTKEPQIKKMCAEEATDKEQDINLSNGRQYDEERMSCIDVVDVGHLYSIN